MALPLLATWSTASAADYYCTIGTSVIGAAGDGTGSGCLLWDGVSAPPAPPVPSGGGSAPAPAAVPAGGGAAKTKDVCPNGDLSLSYYDRRCDADPTADGMINAASAKLNAASLSMKARAVVVMALSKMGAAGKSIPAFPSDSRRILESVAQIVAAGTGTSADVPGAAEFCGSGARYSDISSRGVGRKLGVLVSCGMLPEGTVVSEGEPAYRGEAVVAFAKAFGLRPYPGTTAFSDVPDSLAPIYKSASIVGMAVRGPDGSFSPAARLTFSDLRRMMLSVGAYDSAAAAPDTEDFATYADVVSATYSCAKEKGMLTGSGNPRG